MPPLHRELHHLTVASASPKPSARIGKHPVYNKLRSPRQPNRQQTTSKACPAPRASSHAAGQSSSSVPTGAQASLQIADVPMLPTITKVYCRAKQRTGPAAVKDSQADQQASAVSLEQGHAEGRLHQGGHAEASQACQIRGNPDISGMDTLGVKAVVRRQSSRNKVPRS